MRQAELIIKNQPIKTSVLIFSPAATVEIVEPQIFVHCDLCGEHATATRSTLEAQGWGIYDDKAAFCPTHEEMV